jgi:hypothetical protein
MWAPSEQNVPPSLYLTWRGARAEAVLARSGLTSLSDSATPTSAGMVQRPAATNGWIPWRWKPVGSHIGKRQHVYVKAGGGGHGEGRTPAACLSRGSIILSAIRTRHPGTRRPLGDWASSQNSWVSSTNGLSSTIATTVAPLSAAAYSSAVAAPIDRPHSASGPTCGPRGVLDTPGGSGRKEGGGGGALPGRGAA